MANFKVLSRYTNGIITKDRDGTDFLVLRKPLKLEPDEGDLLVEITQDLAKRPDQIAHKAYGNSDLWWAILEFNGISDPLFDIIPGQIFRIPEIGRLTEAISKLGT
jgi:hypothetical protein